MFLDGFALSMYRSFGPEVQLIGPLSKINIIVGQNNSGKSNTLYFLRDHLRSAIQELHTSRGGARKLQMNGLDIPLDKMGKQILGIALNHHQNKNKWDDTLRRWRELLHKIEPDNVEPLITILEQILKSSTLCHETDATWFLYDGAELQGALVNALVEEVNIEPADWRRLYYPLMHSLHSYISHGQDNQPSPLECATFILTELSPIRYLIPQVDIIPALRRVGDVGSKGEINDFSGMGIIEKLMQLQNPRLEDRHHKLQFAKINHFLQEVLGKKNATLHIPHDQSAIDTEVDGRSLPLSHLGTGVHQVIILAAAATVVENQILCIEEPELHLHPILQRKLLRYLSEKTSNQYFITTHSAHLLDTQGAQIFHVRHQEGQSFVDPAYTATARAAICSDLGYRSSDLVQANSIIWVEGPTDRLYINHWIKAFAVDLVEGLHYSVMFYGGRLLSHLSANDPEIGEFISLRRLNRYISILMDSDRASISDTINETKARIEAEFNSGPGFAWITDGREVENYVAPDILEKSIKATHQNVEELLDTSQFAHPYLFKKPDGTPVDDVKKVDKVKIAHSVVSEPANLDVLDLRGKIGKLVDFIRSANDDEVA